MTLSSVHVFAGTFRDIDDACAYSEAQGEPEPPASATDEEYRAWEQRNPVWPLRADLGVTYLDGDFIETIGDLEDLGRYDYLRNMLEEPGDIERIRALAGPEANVLVLVFDEALGGFDAETNRWAPRSTPRLTYCGAYPCTI
jgi:hypothetical protein